MNAQSRSTTGRFGAVTGWHTDNARVGAGCVVETGISCVQACGISETGFDKACGSGISEWRESEKGD